MNMPRSVTVVWCSGTAWCGMMRGSGVGGGGGGGTTSTVTQQVQALWAAYFELPWSVSGSSDGWHHRFLSQRASPATSTVTS